jgi:alpha-1,6-mannosyltransferase
VGAPRGTAGAGIGAALWAVAALLVVLMLLVIVSLPWAGDLGVHAATVERLRHRLLDPGNPLVDENTPSPYYSPWTVFLGVVARLTGLSVWAVLRIGALISLTLLVTGVWRYVRTLSAHRLAPPLALLCLVFLWGTRVFNWSGFLGLNSLALTIAYPSVLALGLAFHFWALLTRAAKDGGWAAFLGLGALWAVILLSHQFTGVVATLGASATMAGARAGRRTWLRLAAGVALGAALLAVWPYYDFFALSRVGGLDALDAIHRPLYQHLFARFCLVSAGVVALGVRARRDWRDPLVVFFVLGALMFGVGGLTGHYSWGRALPAALIPAQLAAAVEAVGATRGALRNAAAGVLAAALAVGAWTQAQTVGYVTGRSALPGVVADKYRTPWAGYHWITPWVRYGDVVMARTGPARGIPAYGAYTVAPGYPDFFLPDEGRRQAAVRTYFAAGSSRTARLGVLREYAVRWVVQRPSDGGLPTGDRALRRVASGPGGQVLYEVVR